MRATFYDNPEYKKKQAEITHHYWQIGRFDFKRKSETRTCQNSVCSRLFIVKPSDLKRFCSKSCSASVINKGRIISLESRIKRSLRMKGRPNPFRGTRKVKYISIFCQNPNCAKQFELAPYLAKRRKYCSNNCVMQIVGRMTTSPKAAKSKPGIRKDVSPIIVFYSTWEANIARVFNLINIKWEYSPTIFNIGLHTYRPDFYLPDSATYVEVKNFMGAYSLMRDQEFRKRYPKIKLNVILKDEYKEIEREYEALIDEWE